MVRRDSGGALPRAAVELIPAADRAEDDDAGERRQREPGEAVLPARQDDERCGERAQGRAEVAADLKQRLREAVRAAGTGSRSVNCALAPRQRRRGERNSFGPARRAIFKGPQAPSGKSNQLAALRLTPLRSAIVDSFLSAAFSSLRLVVSRRTMSSRPSSSAQAIRVP